MLLLQGPNNSSYMRVRKEKNTPKKKKKNPKRIRFHWKRFELTLNKTNLDGPLHGALATLFVALLSLRGITDNEHNRVEIWGKHSHR